MLFAGNGLASVCGVPHGQTKGVGQTDQGQEFTQLVVAGQVAVFQVKPPAFQILEALLDGPALGVELAQLLQARGAKEKKGGGLIQGVIVFVNNDFNPGRVHTQRFAEGAGFSDQYATALAQRTVDGFHNTGSAAALGAAAMVPARQHAHVGFPLVGEIPAVPPVPGRQGLPEPSGRGRVPPAQHPGHDAPTGPLDGQPKPHFAPPLAHKRPHFIQLQRFPLLFLRLFGP